MTSHALEGHSNTVLLDAVGRIELHGFARDNDGNQTVLTVPREDSLAQIGASDATKLPPLSPPPSKGDTVLSLSVVEKVHQDKHATVYQVCVANKEGVDVLVPPLVIKVAARLYGRRVAHEGGIYDVLRPLQGAAVPRCYGYFRTKINHQEMTIKPWDPECDHEQPRPQLDIFDMPNVASSLNILLLEKVGPNVLTQIPSSLEGFKRELITIHEELIPLAVLFNGTSLKKVCFAPESLPGLPGLPSPTHNRVYKWRLVGFGEAERSSFTEMEMKAEITACVGDMIKGADSNEEGSLM